MKEETTRRNFLKGMGIAAAGLTLGGAIRYYTTRIRPSRARTTSPDLYNSPMPKRRLGPTRVEVSMLGLGGQAAIDKHSRSPFHPASAIIDAALDLGVNYIDTAPLYGGGLSESRFGEALKGRRDSVFLATKTHDRTYDGTLRLAEESLKRLQTDHLDLYQMHNIRVPDDLDTAFSRNGAYRAMQRLKDEGVTRFIGITGHRDPQVLLRGIQEREFDTILMALNAADTHFNPFQTDLLRAVVEKDMGIIAMKVTAMNRIFRDDGLSSIEDALGYVYSFPVSTAVLGISQVREIEEDARIAKNFQGPYSVDRLREIESLTEHYAKDANWYKIEWY